MKVMLLGCGKVRQRNILLDDGVVDFSGDELVTVDIDPLSNPDVTMDLCVLSRGEKLPFEENCFDEIHAYDVIEHLGRFGDWRGFFTEFGEYHRVLKGGGKFFILVPIGEDAFADPGHTRIFSESHFCFLSQRFYDISTGLRTTATDYRWFWKNDFDITFMQRVGNHHLAVILRKP